MPGAVIRLPFEASGLAPSTRKYGAVDVGDGEQELVAEHRERGEHVGELVDRGGREAAAGAQRAEQDLGLEERAVVVDVGLPR